MKYKVGDKLFYKGSEWEVKDFWVSELDGWDTYKIIKGNLMTVVNDFQYQEKFIRVDELLKTKKSLDHDQTILHLNELNALKTRQLDELMKFIAHLVPKAHKEYLSHHLNDVQLIDGIMYHVRKGK